jgi:hypothetical protein
MKINSANDVGAVIVNPGTDTLEDFLESKGIRVESHRSDNDVCQFQTLCGVPVFVSCYIEEGSYRIVPKFLTSFSAGVVL